MNVILKCTTVLLSVLACVVMFVFGDLVLANQKIAVADEMPIMVVSDIAYEPLAEKTVVLADSNDGFGEAVETNEGEAEYVSDGVSENEYVWLVYSYDDGDGNGAELIPYDGSGRYNANLNGAWYSGGDFQFSGGSGYDDGSGYSFTWYSEKVLPGGGLNIPGRHVGDEGYVCDGDGNIVIASDDLPEGTVVDVPFGNGVGVVYDSGSGSGNLDVYVSW